MTSWDDVLEYMKLHVSERNGVDQPDMEWAIKELAKHFHPPAHNTETIVTVMAGQPSAQLIPIVPGNVDIIYAGIQPCQHLNKAVSSTAHAGGDVCMDCGAYVMNFDISKLNTGG